MHKCFLILFQRGKTKIRPLGFSQNNSLRLEIGFLHPCGMFFDYVASLTTRKMESQYFFNLVHQNQSKIGEVLQYKLELEYTLNRLKIHVHAGKKDLCKWKDCTHSEVHTPQNNSEEWTYETKLQNKKWMNSDRRKILWVLQTLYNSPLGQEAMKFTEGISLTHTRESHRCTKVGKLALYQIYLSRHKTRFGIGQE